MTNRLLEKHFPVINYEQGYECTKSGHIWSLRLKKYLIPFYWKGYPKVKLCKEGKETTIPIHRVIAKQFIANDNNYPQVNHIDGVKTNNRTENLEWCNNTHNQRHAWSIGLMEGTRKKRSINARKLSPRQVIESKYIRHICNAPYSAIAETYGVDGTTILNRIKGVEYLS